MIGVIGDSLLMLALSMALIQFSTPLLARWRRDSRFLTLQLWASALQLGCVMAAFGALITGYVLSDFSLLTVALNSHTDKPLIYKITASWGNHEGSMMLWLLVLSGFSFAAARRSAYLRPAMLATQGLLATGLLLFILITSSPFVTIAPPMLQGQGLNPLLQDIGLALHPPMLYLGYVGFGVIYAYAVAGMLCNGITTQWAKTIHPWIALSWAFLTFGIGLGSWWAYRELGWGGWWFWDPVENVSLLPWLSGTALMHANRLYMREGRAGHWVLLLSILTFAMSLIGTFIVRSGILISVHSFASDPARGLFILIYLTSVIGVALWLFMRHPQAPPVEKSALFSRAGLILVGNVFLITATLTVLLAIFYPLGLQLAELPTVTVGAPYFNQTILPLLSVTLFLAGIAPSLARRNAKFGMWLKQATPALMATAAVIILIFACIAHEPLLTAGGFGLSAWLVTSTVAWIYRQWRTTKTWPSHGWPMICGHMGLALFTAFLTLSSLHKQTMEAIVPLQGSAEMGEYKLQFTAQELGNASNYAFRQATARITKDGSDVALLQPELRYYPERGMQTTEAAIDSNPLRDVYLVTGLQPEKEKLLFTLHITPGMQGLWLAIILAGTGGLIAAFKEQDKD